jgi:hypothetical protein
MIEDMSLRNLAPRTQEAYIRGCRKLAAFLRRSPDTATAEDIRLFQFAACVARRISSIMRWSSGERLVVLIGNSCLERGC